MSISLSSINFLLDDTRPLVLDLNDYDYRAR